MKNSTLVKKCIDQLKFTSDTSSLHGIPNLTSISKLHPSTTRLKCLTLLWSFCLIVSYSSCAWFMFTSIVDYLNYDVVTNIDIKYMSRIKFPVVSICNFIDGRLSYAPTSLKDMIWLCIYNLNECEYAKDFEYYRDANLGACFRFNSGRALNGSSTPFKYMNGKGAGAVNTLSIMLNVGSVNDSNELIKFRPTSTSRNGMYVFISNENVNSIKDPGVTIQTGVSTGVSLTREIVRLYPRPYSQCVANLTSLNSYESECYRKTIQILSNNYQYHFSDCSNLCLQKHLGEMCGCQSFLTSFYFENMSLCNDLNRTVYECEINSLKSFTDEYLHTCDCPLECESIEYKYSLSYLDYPTRSYAEYLYARNVSGLRSIYPIWNGNTFEDLSMRVAELRIFFGDMKETTIEQNVKTKLSDFVANLGGIMGIFSGFSFLTLVEVIEALVNMSSAMCQHVTLKKNISYD